MTCAKRPGTFQHEAQDAELFASWKVDYVKSDSCFTDANAPTFQPANGTQCSASYTTFEAALNATGRPMVHSVKGPCGRVDAESPSAPPPSPPHQQSCSPADASAVANLRRSSGDIKDNWDSVVRILSDVAAVARYARTHTASVVIPPAWMPSRAHARQQSAVNQLKVTPSLRATHPYPTLGCTNAHSNACRAIA